MKNKEDLTLLLIVPLLLLLALFVTMLLYDNFKTGQVNKELKSNNYECKRELKILKKEKLNWIIKGE